MRPLNEFAEELLLALLAKDPEPILVGVTQSPGCLFVVNTARQLEKRGFAQVGRTDRKEGEVRLYEVTLTTAGRAHAKGK